ncbi:hypothetical protein VTK26DRAFT_1149 [Humicola hyalothermophila]
MCTYDYTPYTGCKESEQHFYIQWMKCHKAVENNRYCSLRKSTKAEALSKLSNNSLSCPLHGPIAVQQHVFQSLQAEAFEEDDSRDSLQETERIRRRQSTKESFERPTHKRVRKRRPIRDLSLAGSDSDSSEISLDRPKTSDGVKARAERSLPERRKTTIVRESVHRRANSADLRQPSRALSVHHVRSEVSLSRTSECQSVPDIPSQSTAILKEARRRATLAIPANSSIIGLPSNPDMYHKANSLQRTKSEGVLRPENKGPADPVPRTTHTSAGDSSPDNNVEQLPFRNPTARRGRRTGPRSVRDRSVDTVMRRIDEHVITEDTNDPEELPKQDAGHIRASMSTPPRSSGGGSPEPQPSDGHSLSPHQGTNCNLQIPKQREQYQCNTSPASGTASPPQQHRDITRPQSRKSLRDTMSSTSNLNLGVSPPQPHHDPETWSLRSTRSRRLEDQIAEARKWAAAREHMPIHNAAAAPARGYHTDVLAHMSEPHLPLAPAAAGRESADSGYRSGPGYGPQSHQRQRSPEVVSPTAAATLPGRRLQKAQQKGEGKSSGRGEGEGGEGTTVSGQTPQGKKPVPAPLDLGNGMRLPPCALPVSLVSPSVVAPGAGLDRSSDKAAKVSLLQRMGLRRKISGLGWGRSGSREVGVEG